MAKLKDEEPNKRKNESKINPIKKKNIKQLKKQREKIIFSKKNTIEAEEMKENNDQGDKSFLKALKAEERNKRKMEYKRKQRKEGNYKKKETKINPIKKKNTKQLKKQREKIISSKIVTIEAEEMEETNDQEDKSFPKVSNIWNLNLHSIRKNEVEEQSSSEDEEEINIIRKKKKLTTADKIKADKAEEERLRSIELDFANLDKIPESADHFDRLVLSLPDNSLNWINYMVFHLQATELDKARAVARRALKTISFREEEERLNIWIALLNLEIRYGNGDSFNNTLKEAIEVNEPFKVYSRVLVVLSDYKKINELNEIILLMTKKFKSKSEMWSMVATSLFQVGLIEKAKQLLNRALICLEQRDHIKTIIRFAILNNQYGETETSCGLFEQILTSYPQRVDVWSQYIDILVKNKQIDVARQILERAIGQKIPSKKLKTLYKKYIDFEQKHGTPENIEKIKESAANYVKSQIDS